MKRNWIAVASAEHVKIGQQQGFMQVCHGKGGPLKRLKGGDRVVYYSPTDVFQGKNKLQTFTAIGTVKESEPYQFDMGDGFIPFRRDVTWLQSEPAEIKPLLQMMEFTADNSKWGYSFRFGLFPVSHGDLRIIAQAMQVM